MAKRISDRKLFNRILKDRDRASRDASKALRRQLKDTAATLTIRLDNMEQILGELRADMSRRAGGQSITGRLWAAVVTLAIALVGVLAAWLLGGIRHG